MQLLVWKIDRMANEVPMDDPTKCDKAVDWDSQTLASFIQKNLWFQRVRSLVELCCRSVLSCETSEVSLLFFLWYIRQNGGILRVSNIKDGHQGTKMKYGTQHMSHYLQK